MDVTRRNGPRLVPCHPGKIVPQRHTVFLIHHTVFHEIMNETWRWFRIAVWCVGTNHLAIIHPFFEVRTPFVALAYRLGPYSRVYDFTYISPKYVPFVKHCRLGWIHGLVGLSQQLKFISMQACDSCFRRGHHACTIAPVIFTVTN